MSQGKADVSAAVTHLAIARRQKAKTFQRAIVVSEKETDQI